MSSVNKKLTGFAMAGVLATSLSACQDNKVDAQPMSSGYQNQTGQSPATDVPNSQNTLVGSQNQPMLMNGKMMDAKCGEAGCSATMGDKNANASCGAVDKNANASCGGQSH